MSNDLGKTLADIFADKYTIPLYQRNFAWRTEEIHQLLQDIYEACRKNPNGNYYIGSLVVMKRHNGDYEVIDGQQRLTVISLIAMLLKDRKGEPVLSRPVLFYDSRPEVQEFFELLCKNQGKPEDALRLAAPSLFYLKEACEFLKTAKADFPDLPDGSEEHVQYLADPQFAEFFLNHVILVRNEIPEDTDVAAYFEIMNNRGEQLQKHEIVKAQMMDKIKVVGSDGKGFHDTIRQGQFAQIWDACSQMDVPIQRLFLAKDRKSFFGENYDGILHARFAPIGAVFEPGEKGKSYSLADIIDGITDGYAEKGAESEEGTETDIYAYSSIIDFPNFLMHVLRLYCNVNEVDATVPLNEKDLLSVYHDYGAKIDSMKFVELLLFCRAVFDRFIVKTTEDASDQEDGRKWVLLKPTKYDSNWKFTSSFEGIKGQQLVAALSMLQVTFRTRIYKIWLYDVLKWFHGEGCKDGNFGVVSADAYKDVNFSDVSADAYLGFLHGWMMRYYDNYNKQGFQIPRIPDGETPSQANSYSEGTATPHFLLNFIDYLYCCQSPEKYLLGGFRFVFKYWNSVEHHLARNNVEEDCPYIHNLGNLFLVSKSSNSRLSDRIVKEKVDKYGNGNLGPNRRLIYDETRDANYEWGELQIRKHYNEIAALLNNRQSILSPDCGSAENEGTSVDLTDNIDELGGFIEQHFFDGITTDKYSITVVRKDDEKWPDHDEEEPQKWCGRYFIIDGGNKGIKAFVGWFYGSGCGGTYKRRPRFVIQIDKDRFPELANNNSTNWYEDSYWGQWMNKDILGDLRDIESVANEFKREIESLCDSK